MLSKERSLLTGALEPLTKPTARDAEEYQDNNSKNIYCSAFPASWRQASGALKADKGRTRITGNRLAKTSTDLLAETRGCSTGGGGRVRRKFPAAHATASDDFKRGERFRPPPLSEKRDSCSSNGNPPQGAAAAYGLLLLLPPLALPPAVFVVFTPAVLVLPLLLVTTP